MLRYRITNVNDTPETWSIARRAAGIAGAEITREDRAYVVIVEDHERGATFFNWFWFDQDRNLTMDDIVDYAGGDHGDPFCDETRID